MSRFRVNVLLWLAAILMICFVCSTEVNSSGHGRLTPQMRKVFYLRRLVNRVSSRLYNEKRVANEKDDKGPPRLACRTRLGKLEGLDMHQIHTLMTRDKPYQSWFQRTYGDGTKIEEKNPDDRTIAVLDKMAVAILSTLSLNKQPWYDDFFKKLQRGNYGNEWKNAFVYIALLNGVLESGGLMLNDDLCDGAKQLVDPITGYRGDPANHGMLYDWFHLQTEFWERKYKEILTLDPKIQDCKNKKEIQHDLVLDFVYLYIYAVCSEVNALSKVYPKA